MLQTRHMINVMSIALIINSPLMMLSSSENLPFFSDSSSCESRSSYTEDEDYVIPRIMSSSSTYPFFNDPTAETLRFKEKRKQQRDINPYLLTLKEKIESPPLQPSEKVSTKLLNSIRAQLTLWYMRNKKLKQTVKYSTETQNKQEKQILQLSPYIVPSSNPQRQSRYLQRLLLKNRKKLEKIEASIAQTKITKDTNFATIKVLALQLPLSIQPKTDIELDFIQTLGKILKEHSLYAKYIYEKNMYTELTKNNKPAQKINFA